jgi:type II secretory pathway pseudopilin PulG
MSEIPGKPKGKLKKWHVLGVLGAVAALGFYAYEKFMKSKGTALSSANPYAVDSGTYGYTDSGLGSYAYPTIEYPNIPVVAPVQTSTQPSVGGGAPLSPYLSQSGSYASQQTQKKQQEQTQMQQQEQVLRQSGVAQVPVQYPSKTVLYPTTSSELQQLLSAWSAPAAQAIGAGGGTVIAPTETVAPQGVMITPLQISWPGATPPTSILENVKTALIGGGGRY